MSTVSMSSVHSLYVSPSPLPNPSRRRGVHFRIDRKSKVLRRTGSVEEVSETPDSSANASTDKEQAQTEESEIMAAQDKDQSQDQEQGNNKVDDDEKEEEEVTLPDDAWQDTFDKLLQNRS